MEDRSALSLPAINKKSVKLSESKNILELRKCTKAKDLTRIEKLINVYGSHFRISTTSLKSERKNNTNSSEEVIKNTEKRVQYKDEKLLKTDSFPRIKSAKSRPHTTAGKITSELQPKLEKKKNDSFQKGSPLYHGDHDNTFHETEKLKQKYRKKTELLKEYERQNQELKERVRQLEEKTKQREFPTTLDICEAISRLKLNSQQNVPAFSLDSAQEFPKLIKKQLLNFEEETAILSMESPTSINGESRLEKMKTISNIIEQANNHVELDPKKNKNRIKDTEFIISVPRLDMTAVNHKDLSTATIYENTADESQKEATTYIAGSLLSHYYRVIHKPFFNEDDLSNSI